MPHKRSKRSAREGKRKQQGSNLAPGKESISNEAVPKSAARVINALKIRDDYRKKRNLEQEGHDDKIKHKRQRTEDTQLKIKPGESIQHFYRRVEDDMRPLVRSATQSCKAVERRTRKTFSGPRMKVSARNLSGTTRSVTDRGLQGQSPPVMVAALRSKSKDPNEDERPKEFVQLSSSAPRRLNDIAQGPPEIKEMARSAKYAKREGILSVAQKSMMEQEREKAIARYRTLKASRLSTVGNE